MLQSYINQPKASLSLIKRSKNFPFQQRSFATKLDIECIFYNYICIKWEEDRCQLKHIEMNNMIIKLGT